MFENIKDKIKNKGFFKEGTYGKTWQERSGEEQSNWYKRMHESCIPMHEDFIKFLEKNSVDLVLEIGCGTGYYPINFEIDILDFLLNILELIFQRPLLTIANHNLILSLSVWIF